jgi:hypothetical protein
MRKARQCFFEETSEAEPPLSTLQIIATTQRVQLSVQTRFDLAPNALPALPCFFEKLCMPPDGCEPAPPAWVQRLDVQAGIDQVCLM